MKTLILDAAVHLGVCVSDGVSDWVSDGVLKGFLRPCRPAQDDTVTQLDLFFYVFAFSWTPQTNKRPSLEEN